MNTTLRSAALRASPKGIYLSSGSPNPTAKDEVTGCDNYPNSFN